MSTFQEKIVQGYGPVFVFLMISCVLYGIGCIQTYWYFKQNKEDRTFLKSMVHLSFILNTFQQALTLADNYDRIIVKFGDPTTLTYAPWTTSVQILIAALSDFVVRSFFARRAYILCKTLSRGSRIFAPILGAVIVLLSVIVVIFRCIFTFENYELVKLGLPVAEAAVRREASRWKLYIGQGCSAAVDILIAASICGLLFANRTGFRRTDSLVIHLITLSVSSGLIASIFALSAMLCNIVGSNINTGRAVGYLLCQLHFNSLLLSLNTREYLRGSQSSWTPHSHGTRSAFAVNVNATDHHGVVGDSQVKTMNHYAIPLTDTNRNMKLTITKEVETYVDGPGSEDGDQKV